MNEHIRRTLTARQDELEAEKLYLEGLLDRERASLTRNERRLSEVQEELAALGEAMAES